MALQSISVLIVIAKRGFQRKSVNCFQSKHRLVSKLYNGFYRYLPVCVSYIYIVFIWRFHLNLPLPKPLHLCCTLLYDRNYWPRYASDVALWPNSTIRLPADDALCFRVFTLKHDYSNMTSDRNKSFPYALSSNQ